MSFIYLEVFYEYQLWVIQIFENPFIGEKFFKDKGLQDDTEPLIRKEEIGEHHTLGGLEIEIEVYTKDGKKINLDPEKLHKFTNLVKDMMEIRKELKNLKEFNIKPTSISTGTKNFQFKLDKPIKKKLHDIGQLLGGRILEPTVKTTIVKPITAPLTQPIRGRKLFNKSTP